ncbi:MAG TPA: oligosaccharide flippase family protein [Polyangiaceae bacterium]|jgi:O-antigen/teichoic acid export membrane protein
MTPGREHGSAIRNLSLKALSLGLERGCRLVVVVVSAPVLGEAAFGRFVFASTVTAMLALGTDLGLGVWTTRALARTDGEANGVRIVRVGLELRALASVPYALAIAGAVALSAPGEPRASMALLGAAALLYAFLDHFGAIFRGREMFADEARLNVTRAILTAAAGLAMLAARQSLTALCAGLAAANLAGALYGLAVLGRLRLIEPRAWQGKVDRALAGAALRAGLPIWIAGLVSLLYFKVDTLFVRSFCGEAELGTYGAAYKIFEGAMIVPAVVLAVAFPRLSRAHGDPPAQRALEWRISGLLVGLGLLAGAACFFGRTMLVALLYRRGFARAEAPLEILALGLPLVFVNYGLTHFLLARDRGRVTTWLSAMMLLVTVALDLALIPRYRSPGAAAATALAEIALTAGCLAALALERTTSARRVARRDRRAA